MPRVECYVDINPSPLTICTINTAHLNCMTL